MPQFFKRWQLVLVIVLAILLIALAVLTSGQRDNLTKIEGVVGDIISPVQGFMYRVATSVSQFFQSITQRQQLLEEYESSKGKSQPIGTAAVEMDEVIRKIKRLKRLLDFKEEKMISL